MEIQGERLILRSYQFSDLTEIQKWLHPSEEWCKFDSPYSITIGKEFKQDIISKWNLSTIEKDGEFPEEKLMIIKSDVDQVIGIVTWNWVSKTTVWPSIGIIIFNPKYWNKGYGFDALELWCDYLFEAEPRFHRIDIRTWSGNRGMMKLAEKLGFKKEAVFRKARIVNGKFYDSIGYGILREEWNKRTIA